MHIRTAAITRDLKIYLRIFKTVNLEYTWTFNLPIKGSFFRTNKKIKKKSRSEIKLVAYPGIWSDYEYDKTSRKTKSLFYGVFFKQQPHFWLKRYISELYKKNVRINLLSDDNV